MNLDGACRGVSRGNEKPVVAHLIAVELFLFVTGLDALGLGQYPDLKQMHRFRFRGIELTVRHTGARAHPLRFARPDDGTGTHAISVFKGSIENVCDDFHIPMRMRWEPSSCSDPVVVDDSQ